MPNMNQPFPNSVAPAAAAKPAAAPKAKKAKVKAKAKAKKPAAKAKKAPKAKKAKPAPKAKAKKAEKPDRGMADVPAHERKKTLVKRLQGLKAVSAQTARPVTELVEKLGFTRFDVYGLVNGTGGVAGSAPRCLRATKHVAVTQAEEEKGLSFYLTKKGAAADFSAPPFIAGRTKPAPKK